MQHRVSCLIQDADVHGSGVQIDAAIVFVLLGIESHRVSSFGVKVGFLQKAFYHALRRRP